MKTKIYYFSGTGNSLFIAKKLHDTFEDSELVPIIKTLNESPRKIVAEKVIIIFPIYALTIPLPVRHFLKRNNFDNVQYLSAIATRLGIYFNDFKRIDKLLKTNRLNSHFILNMGHNDIKVKDYKSPSINKIKQLEDTALSELKQIIQIISNKIDSRKRDLNYLENLPFGDFRDKMIWWLIPKMMTFSRFIGGVNYFYINSQCNGCGLCSKVCLSSKISVNNKRPVWNRKVLCHMCYACINYCPMKAIEINSIPGVTSYSNENGRYCHPYAEYKEIEDQKC